jgi:hypothetical protein
VQRPLPGIVPRRGNFRLRPAFLTGHLQEDAMKSIIPISLVVVCLTAMPATAKTITTTQGNANEQSTAAVAGPAQAANNTAMAQVKHSTRPGKKALMRSKIKPPPPLHDPN